MLMFNFILSASIIFALMLATFCIALIKKDNSIIDIVWAFGFIATTITTLPNERPLPVLSMIIILLVLMWGLRLSCYIYLRSIGKGEDARYKKWRSQWGKHIIIRSFFQIFILQGIILLIIAYPLILINSHTQQAFTLVSFIGLFIWLIGFAFEVIGDFQLHYFLSKPENAGKICTIGLWRYTRHPNYFGESLLWWGIFLLAVQTPFGYTATISPALITFLLRFVSGVPLAEKQLEHLPEFSKYKQETSPFIPWFYK